MVREGPALSQQKVRAMQKKQKQAKKASANKKNLQKTVAAQKRTEAYLQRQANLDIENPDVYFNDEDNE